MSAIKPKIGKCSKCGKEGGLTAALCHSCYWQAVRLKSAQKAKKMGKASIIPAKSEKQIARDIKYAKLRKEWMGWHRECQAKLSGCRIFASHVHHMAGRSGELLFDTSKWKSVCWSCHELITKDSAMAIQLGLSLRRNT